MQRRKFHITRDMVLFVAGLAGIIYETLGENTDRPYLLILFAGMIGLPAFLNRDENGKFKLPFTITRDDEGGGK